MKRKTLLLCFVALWIALSFQNAPTTVAQSAAAAKPKPMELADILAWKNIGMTAISTDGRWFAYRFAPTDGDAEVVVRQLQGGDKEYRFVVGDARSGGGPILFSDDGKWAAFSVAPSKKEAAQLRRQRRPLQNKVTILNLQNGVETKIDKIARYAFSGERATWIALKKAGAEAPGVGAAAPAPAAPAPGAAAAAPADDRPRGADLILRELASGNELNVGNVNEFAFDKSGKFLAWTIDAADKMGNGVELRNMETGVVTPLDGAKASYERLNWTEKGDALAVMRATEDKRYKDKVYAVVAWSGFAGAAPQKTTYDPAEDKSFPEGMAISPDRTATWTEDLSAIYFGIRTPKKADAKPDAKPGEEPPATPPPPAAGADDEKPDLVIWHYKDPRLQSQQQVQEAMDKSFNYFSEYRVKEKKFIRLADDTVRSVSAAPKDKFAIGTDVREYELTASLSGYRYQDVYVINLQTGERKLALKKLRNMGQPSQDGTKFAYYEDGNYFVYDMISGQSTNLTKLVPTSFIDVEDDHNMPKPPTPTLGWTKDSDAMILSDGWDLWKVPVSGGVAVNLTVNGRKDGIRYRSLARLDPEERGWDLSIPRYVQMFGEFTKKGGVGRLEAAKPGIQPLLWDDASFGQPTKAKKADVYLISKSTATLPTNYYLTDPSLKLGKKLTNADEQAKAFTMTTGSIIVDYTVPLIKGQPPKKLQGSLSLPANYEKGKTYPMVVYIYEKLTQSHNAFATPSANGFNKTAYTSNGYAVLQPDITYRLNDPGVSAVMCITAAVKAAIATGVVDPKHIGLQGHSWGGYQTAFTVTQTDIFAAAVAGAPLTNMVSMYSLIYKNSGGTNQAIFESSQGRFLGTYNDNWEAYVRNSPVYFAKNVKTPLIILHNDKDGAVDFTQGVEYYNTLRRLGKQVVMLEYPGENHGLAKPANMEDYTVRMKEFFDHYLQGEALARLVEKGVSRLDMDDHIKARLEQQKKAAQPAEVKK